MAFEDKFRLSSHAVITNDSNDVLLLKANYGTCSWGLPGGALDPGETIHEALVRECREEMTCEIKMHYLSGVYYHSAYNSQAFIFRCEILHGSEIILSSEHTEYQYAPINTLSTIQQRRVNECLHFNGNVKSARF